MTIELPHELNKDVREVAASASKPRFDFEITRPHCIATTGSSR
jgi:hypothetical protein